MILGAGGRFVIDARIWFKGPVINLSDEERKGRELEMNLADEEQSGGGSSTNEEEKARQLALNPEEPRVLEAHKKQ